MKHDERKLIAKLTKAGWTPAEIRYYLNSKDRMDLAGSHKQLHDKLKIFNFGESTMDLESTKMMTALIEAVKKIKMGKGKGELGSIDPSKIKKEKSPIDGKGREDNERLEESRRGPQQPSSIGAGRRTLGGVSQATIDRAAAIRKGGYFNKPEASDRGLTNVADNDGKDLGHIQKDPKTNKHHAFNRSGKHIGTFDSHKDAYNAVESDHLKESELLTLIKTLRETNGQQT